MPDEFGRLDVDPDVDAAMEFDALGLHLADAPIDQRVDQRPRQLRMVLEVLARPVAMPPQKTGIKNDEVALPDLDAIEARLATSRQGG